MIISAVISFSLLSEAMRSIPAGTAYTVWTAIGAVVLSILFLKEFAEPVRLVGIALIVAGVVALRFAEAA